MNLTGHLVLDPIMYILPSNRVWIKWFSVNEDNRRENYTISCKSDHIFILISSDKMMVMHRWSWYDLFILALYNTD